MIKEKLRELGFSEKEVKVYLALLEMGSAVASDIAQKAGIKRSTAYVVLDSLSGRGLVSMIDRRGVSVYQAAPPQQLVQYLKGMATRYAGLADTAKELLPQLPLSRTGDIPAPKVHFFEGEKGVKTVYEDTLASLEEIRVHAAFAHGERAPAGAAVAPRRKAGINPHTKLGVGVKMQIVFPEALGKGKKTAPENTLRKAIMASREESGVSSEINVYDDRVVFISAAEDFALVVESRELADALRKTFAASEPEKDVAKKAILRPAFAL